MGAAAATCSRRLGRARRTAADVSRGLATSAASISPSSPAAQSIPGAVVHDRWNCGLLFWRLFWPNSGNHRTHPRADSPLEDQKLASRVRRKTVCDCGRDHRRHKHVRWTAGGDLVDLGGRVWVTVGGSLEFIVR